MRNWLFQSPRRGGKRVKQQLKGRYHHLHNKDEAGQDRSMARSGGYKRRRKTTKKTTVTAVTNQTLTSARHPLRDPPPNNHNPK
jgi:hypothetical protein